MSHYLACAAGVCNEAFSMFNCRSLDGDIQLLRTDFRVDCTRPQHQLFKIIAGAVLVLFAVGGAVRCGSWVPSRGMSATAATMIPMDASAT